MNKEQLTTEILIQCQNVQCGAKLVAEIHYIYKDTLYEPEDILSFEEILNNFPDLKYLIYFNPDKQSKKDGWKSLFIYKYNCIEKLIAEIDLIRDKNSNLYHFAYGKLFGYNDYEVMKFIEKNCK